MIFKHVFGLLVSPNDEWQLIRSEPKSVSSVMFQVGVLALIPVVAAFIGSTAFGWDVGGQEHRMPLANAVPIAVTYWVALMFAVYSVGTMIRWMAQTYGAKPTFEEALALAAYIPVPMFIVGAMQLVPVIWLNLVVALPAIAHMVFLLYTGVPTMMNIPAERGFLFASAVLAFGMVGFVGLLALTAILWGIGIGPAMAEPLAALLPGHSGLVG